MQHFVPCTDKVDGKKLGERYIKKVFRLHRLPETMVSVRGPEFALEFWKQVCERSGLEPRLSTAFQSQTNCKTSKINVVMELYRWNFVNYLRDDWVRWLP
jgi:hypothetical protein